MTWIAQHKLIFLLVIVAIAVGVWFGLSSGSTPPPLLTSETVGGATTSSEQQLVGSLLTLRAVTLSGTIFSNQAFISLRDYGTTIVPEPVGRPNPFEAINAGSAARTTSTSTPSR